MEYGARKEQLNRAMLEALKKLEYGFYFDNEITGRKVFYPIFCDEPREEILSEVFIDDDNDITVLTWVKDDPEDAHEEIESTTFTHFSNDEMIQIMEMCGVPVPAEI